MPLLKLLEKQPATYKKRRMPLQRSPYYMIYCFMNIHMCNQSIKMYDRRK